MTRAELHGRDNPDLVRDHPETKFKAGFRKALGIYFGIRHNLRVEFHPDMPRHGPYIGLFNHSSVLDPLILMRADPFHPTSAAIAKESMVKAPITGNVLKSWGVIGLKRNGDDVDAKSQMDAVLDEGHGIGIAPEGTRSTTGRMNPLDAVATGMLVSAAERGVAIFAIGISGAYEALPKGKIIPKAGQIDVKMGPQLDLSPWFGRRHQRLTREERTQAALYIRGEMMKLVLERYHPLPDTPAIWTQKDYVPAKKVKKHI